MTNLLCRLLANAIALGIVAHLGIGVEVKDVPSLLEATVVIGLVNSLIRPVVALFTMPLNCATLGFFGLVVNALLFAGTHLIVPNFHIVNATGFFLGPVLMGLLSGLLSNLLPDKKKER